MEKEKYVKPQLKCFKVQSMRLLNGSSIDAICGKINRSYQYEDPIEIGYGGVADDEDLEVD